LLGQRGTMVRGGSPAYDREITGGKIEAWVGRKNNWGIKSLRGGEFFGKRPLMTLGSEGRRASL